MPSIAEVVDGIPVALNLSDPEPIIGWCDMRGERLLACYRQCDVIRRPLRLRKKYVN